MFVANVLGAQYGGVACACPGGQLWCPSQDENVGGTAARGVARFSFLPWRYKY